MPLEFSQPILKIPHPQISRRNQISLAEIVLLATIVGLFYWFIVMPKKEELNGLQMQVEELHLQQTRVEAEKQDLERFIRAMKSDPESILNLNEALPANGKVMSLHLLTEKLASEAGVVLDTLSFNSSADVPLAGDQMLIADPYSKTRSLRKILGSVSIKGQLSQVKAFLEKMEGSGRIFDITEFQITADPLGEIHLTAALNAYYFGP